MNVKFVGLLSLTTVLVVAGMASAQSPGYSTPYGTGVPSKQPTLGQRISAFGESIFGKSRYGTSSQGQAAPARSAQAAQTASYNTPDEAVMIDGQPVRRSAAQPASGRSTSRAAGVPYVAQAPQAGGYSPGERSIYMRQTDNEGEGSSTGEVQREVVSAWVEEPGESTNNADLEAVLYGRRPATPAVALASGQVPQPSRRASAPSAAHEASTGDEAGFASAESTPSGTHAPAAVASAPAATNPTSRPLHERLQTLQRSAFNRSATRSATAPSAPKPQPAPAAAQPAPVATQPTPAVAQPAPAVTEAAPAAAQPAPVAAPVAASPAPVSTQPTWVSAQPAPAAAIPARVAAQPTWVAAQPTPAAAGTTPSAEPISSAPVTPPVAADPAPASPVEDSSEMPSGLADTVPPGSASALLNGAENPDGQKPVTPGVMSGDRRVLFAGQNPALGVETLGPRQIVVGKKSLYEFRLENTGDAGATDVVVYVDLPAWAEVTDAFASAGTTETDESVPESRVVAWKVGHLDAHAKERLELRIIPRESKPFDLAVRWDFQPVTSQASIEVQEPRLELALDGPREVLFGHGEVYKLKLSNTGNGAAENVVLSLLPMGTETPVVQNLGTLAAGTDRVMELELTARQAGDLQINVSAKGEGSAFAELKESVFVRRADLQLTVEGPKFQYVGTVGTYHIAMANAGSADAQNVMMTARLPAGARYISGIEGAKFDEEKSEVQWPAGNLQAGNQQAYEMRCTFTAPGNGRMEIVSADSDGLNATAEAITRVEAMADLAMEVIDPSGPVPVGEDAVYELQVQNRGTKSAQGVEIVIYFSNGIEPTKVEGGAHKIGPGQVVFSPVNTLDAGQTLSLKVSARAEAPGNHIFRAEVYCRPLGARLVSEETTHFYNAEELANSPTAEPSAGKPAGTPTAKSPAAEPPVRETSAVPGPTSPRTAARLPAAALAPPAALPAVPRESPRENRP